MKSSVFVIIDSTDPRYVSSDIKNKIIRRTRPAGSYRRKTDTYRCSFIFRNHVVQQSFILEPLNHDLIQ